MASLEQFHHQPWLRQSWEGFVIEQTLAVPSARGERVQPYFFRTSDGHELDLVLDWGTRRWAIEIKLTSNSSPDTIARLHKAADMIDAGCPILVCRIGRKIENDELVVTGVGAWLRRFMQQERRP